ncbi:RmlC-like cupin, partial [Panus rudis PR-1116 ss-1]
ELGPLGANGLANVRDFEHPVASFDVDQSNWDSEYFSHVYPLGGVLFNCKQDHTPFDVVAWHGNYVPYKYAMEKFVAVGNLVKDHADPSCFCVLTVKSKTPGIPLLNFGIVVPKWEVTTNTFRPPYFHRNTAGEMIGFIYGGGPHFPPHWQDGGLNYRAGFCPHGVPSEVFKQASEAELVPIPPQEGLLVFLIEPANMLMFTEHALKHNGFFEAVEPYRSLAPNFLKNIDKVNADLHALGRPKIHVS